MKLKLTAYARLQIRTIFLYHKHAASISVARKIKRNILDNIKYLEQFPESGQREEYMDRYGHDFRRIISGNYKIIYRIEEQVVLITDVFDGRQDPTKAVTGNL